VTAAYCVVFAVVLVYVVIIALKLHRLEREVDDLARHAGAQSGEASTRERAAVG
jgi:CcmD family protein